MTLRDRFEQMEPREQKLLTLLGSVLAVMVVLLIPLLVGAMVSSQRQENEQLRLAIESIHDARERIGARQLEKRQLDARYGRPAPALASFLEKLASDLGVEIPESQDRPPVPHGKRFEERSTKVVLNRVGMLKVVTFMERLENSGHPVRFSSVSIRKRPTDPDSFDIVFVVSAFDRKQEKVKGAAAGGSDEAQGEASEEEE